MNTTCPFCGHTVKIELRAAIDETGALQAGRRESVTGDLSICGKCGEMLEFDASLTLVGATIKTLNQITPDQSKAIDAVIMYQRLNRSKQDKTQ